jgi:type IV secretory pathway TraG/TraD family ATPase VirD4
MDVDTICASLIPIESKEPFFAIAARDLLFSCIYYCILENEKNYDFLCYVLSKPIPEMAEMLGKYTECSRGYKHVSFEGGKADSVMSTMSIYTMCFEYMSRLKKESFDLNKYLTGHDEGMIFLPMPKMYAATLKPIVTLFVDLFSTIALNLLEDYKRRIFLFIDEVSNLQKLQTLGSLFRMGRTRGLCIFIGTQSVNDLFDIYGKNLTQGIVNAASNCAIFRTIDPVSTDYLSKYIGKAEMLRTRDGMMISAAHDNRINSSEERSMEDLVMPSEIQNLKDLYFYCRYGSYPWLHEKLKYKKYKATHEFFIQREDLDIDYVKKSQERNKYLVEEVLSGAGEFSQIPLDEEYKIYEEGKLRAERVRDETNEITYV